MTTLHDDVRPYGSDPAAMAALATSCGLGSTEAAARAYSTALPTVVHGFSSTVEWVTGATLLHTLGTRLSRTEREHPDTLFGVRGHPLSRSVVEQVFGAELPSVQSDVARDAGLGTADRLIEIVSLVCLASAAGPSPEPASMAAFVAGVGAVGAAGAASPPPTPAAVPASPMAPPAPVIPPLTTPPSPTPPTMAPPIDPAASAPLPPPLPAVTATPDGVLAPPASVPPPVAAAAPLVIVADAPELVEDDPAVDDEERSKMPWLIGGAAALLLLVGLVAFLGDDDSNDPVTAATTAAVDQTDDEAEIVAPATDVVDSIVAAVDPEPPLTDVVETDTEPIVTEPPVDGDGGMDMDFANLAEGPDIEAMSIPLRDINDPARKAAGALAFTFNKVTGEVCYGVRSDGISGPYSSHIHAGDFGVKGGIVVELGKLESGDSRCVDNLPVDTNAILADPAGHYAEIHDTGDEWTLRGQLTESVAGDIVTLSVPMTDAKAINPDAEGLLTFDFNTVSGEICYSVESTGVAGPYSSHIHVGPVGVKGGIVVELGQLESGDSRCVDNLPVDTNAILADPAAHYAELHDTSDEWTVRGQLSNTVVAGAGGAAEETGDVAAGETSALVDPDGGGAFIRLDQGTIYLEGAVADQGTADSLAGSLSAVDAGTPVVNNLSVEAGAPLPSGRIVIADAIFFATDSSELQSIDGATLVAITALARSQPGAVLTVVGHTDDRGSDVVNLELSLRRATASRDLLAALGLPDENLRIRGAGETAPIGDNTTIEGRSLNRRIEFELAPST